MKLGEAMYAQAQSEGAAGAAGDLHALDGREVRVDVLAKFAEHQIHTRDDLAELAVDELTELTGIGEDEAKANRQRVVLRFIDEKLEENRSAHAL